MPCFLAGGMPGSDGGSSAEGASGGGFSPAGASGSGPLVGRAAGAFCQPLSGMAPFRGHHRALYTQPHGWNLDCSRIGGTTDISAGQLIDRTGQLLELPFPAGKALDRLSQEAGAVERLPGEVPGDGIFPVRCGEPGAAIPGPDRMPGGRRRPLLWPAFAVPWKPPPVTPGSGIRAFRWCFPGRGLQFHAAGVDEAI